MKAHILQIIGFIGATGSWAVSVLAVLNVYLQTASLLIGVTLGAWALITKIRKRCGRQ